MGRRSTGAVTTKEAVRIELSYLLRKGYIRKGYRVTGLLTWTNGSSINIVSKYTQEEKYLRLIYTLTDAAGKKVNLDYQITLHTKASNLGRGKVLYFVCPQSGNLCRVLYRAYKSNIWKSRLAYSNRIYYPLQISSKISKYNDRYWEVEKELKELSNRKMVLIYNGNATRRALRLEKLEKVKAKLDVLRWSSIAMSKSLRKALKNNS